MGPNHNETISSVSSIDEIEQHDGLNSAAECEKPSEANVFPEQKKKQVSIDVTKALMVFGFSSWSTLEEGVKQNNSEEMNTKLDGLVEQRRKDRREYLALINATKALNFGLYQMMSSANNVANNHSRIESASVDNTGKLKTKAGFNDKPSNVLEVPNNNIATSNNNCNSNTNNDRSKILNISKSPKGCKSTVTKKKFQKVSKKVIQGTKSLPSTFSNEDNKSDESNHDEEEVAITWAHSVLLKEFNRRCDLRHESKGTNKRINHKLVAFQKFKRLQEEQRKKDAKNEAKGETIYRALESNKPEYDTNTNINDNENINENDLDPNAIHENASIEIKTEDEKEHLNNHKIQIVSLQDQIRKEKDRSHISMVSGVFVSDTEKEKIKEAKKVLRRLHEVAEVKKQKEEEEQERIRQQKRKEEEKQRLAQLRRILSMKAVDQENVVVNDNETAELNEEGDGNKNAADELKALEAKANAVKTMWKKKPATKSSIKKKKKGSCEFEVCNQGQVKQQGFVLTEEEEKMVQDAIARRLAENKDSGVDLDDSEVDDTLEVEDVFS